MLSKNYKLHFPEWTFGKDKTLPQNNRYFFVVFHHGFGQLNFEISVNFCELCTLKRKSFIPTIRTKYAEKRLAVIINFMVGILMALLQSFNFEEHWEIRKNSLYSFSQLVLPMRFIKAVKLYRLITAVHSISGIRKKIKPNIE